MRRELLAKLLAAGEKIRPLYVVRLLLLLGIAVVLQHSLREDRYGDVHRSVRSPAHFKVWASAVAIAISVMVLVGGQASHALLPFVAVYGLVCVHYALHARQNTTPYVNADVSRWLLVTLSVAGAAVAMSMRVYIPEIPAIGHNPAIPAIAVVIILGLLLPAMGVGAATSPTHPAFPTSLAVAAVLHAAILAWGGDHATVTFAGVVSVHAIVAGLVYAYFYLHRQQTTSPDTMRWLQATHVIACVLVVFAIPGPLWGRVDTKLRAQLRAITPSPKNNPNPLFAFSES